ncbi:hypothetical protein PROFUN_05444 [Planoprotostelium fungivorum]|uniref:Telomere-associated protein Rif1 N-terminal domain-containing protein n=1 Tax=Planoprotostelium fungivorum TaxID=1890364 RepID=A0A2P6NQR5_9EUKA|nr:hypothetical protein PROFUN_05444 [Planoprotostelium fungivorum]
METIKNAVNYVSESVQGGSAAASKEVNKEIAKDSDVSIGTRLHAGVDALKDKSEEKGHDAKAETRLTVTICLLHIVRCMVIRFIQTEYFGAKILPLNISRKQPSQYPLVAMPGEEITSLLDSLEERPITETRAKTYDSLLSFFKDDQLVEEHLVVLKNASERLIDQMLLDVNSNNRSLAALALKGLGFLTHRVPVSTGIKAEQTTTIWSSIVNIIQNTDDKRLCNYSYWWLSVQSLSSDCLTPKLLSDILDCCLRALGPKIPFDSKTIEFEALDSLSKMILTVPAFTMSEYSSRWLPVLYNKMLYADEKFRKKATEAIINVIPHLGRESVRTQTFTGVPAQVSGIIFQDMKESEGVSRLKKLIDDGEDVSAIKMWGVIVHLLGSSVMKEGLLNRLLSLIEGCFSSPKPDVRIECTLIWRYLIVNFSTHGKKPSKRMIDLMMRPLMTSVEKGSSLRGHMAHYYSWCSLVNSMNEDISKEFGTLFPEYLKQFIDKTKSWMTWALVCDMMVKLLNNPPFNNSFSSLGSLIPIINTAGDEIIVVDPFEGMTGHITTTTVLQHFDFFLHLLKHPPSPATPTQATSESEAPTKTDPREALWSAIVARLSAPGRDLDREYLVSSLLKLIDFLPVMLSGMDVQSGGSLISSLADSLDSFALFSSNFQVEHKETDKEGQGSVTSLGKISLWAAIFSEWIKKDLGLPNGADGNTIRKMWESSSEFRVVVRHLIRKLAVGVNLFPMYRHALQLLDRRTAHDLLEISTNLDIWCEIVTSLDGHVTRTDTLTDKAGPIEEDFSLVYNALLYPIRLEFSRNYLNRRRRVLSEMSPRAAANLSDLKFESTEDDFNGWFMSIVDKCLLQWKKFFSTFHKISTLKNPNPNVGVDGLCSRLNLLLSNEGPSSEAQTNPAGGRLVFRYASEVFVMLFKTVDLYPSFGLPKKWKTSTGPANLSNLMEFSNRLFVKAHQNLFLEQNSEDDTPKKLIEGLSQCFRNIGGKMMSTSQDMVVYLLEELSKPLQTWLEDPKPQSFSGSSAARGVNLQLEVEDLWDQILSCLLRTFPKGSFTSQLLEKISPLLRCGFGSKHRHIKNETITFWNKSFGTSEELVYPAILVPLLGGLRSKISIDLPQWNEVEGEEKEMTGTLAVDASLSIDEVKIQTPVLKSKKKKMETKRDTPQRDPSPPKKAKSSATESKPSIRSPEEEDSKFVAIVTEPQREEILTERQKEVRENARTKRRAMPATYTTLDQTQDASLKMEVEDDKTQEIEERASGSKRSCREEKKQEEEAPRPIKKKRLESDEPAQPRTPSGASTTSTSTSTQSTEATEEEALEILMGRRPEWILKKLKKMSSKQLLEAQSQLCLLSAQCAALINETSARETTTRNFRGNSETNIMTTSLVTGASRGLGLEIVRQLAQTEGSITFAGVRDPTSTSDAFKKVVAEARGKVILVALDIEKQESVDEAVKTVRQHTSTLDLLVNNAAWAGDIQPLPEQGIDQFTSHFEINCVSQLRVIRGFIDFLLAGSGKKVVNISSNAGSIANTKVVPYGPYAVSKAALNMLTKLHAEHYRQDGVIFLSIHPGFLQTDMGTAYEAKSGHKPPMTPQQSAEAMLKVIGASTVEDSGSFKNWEGVVLPY